MTDDVGGDHAPDAIGDRAGRIRLFDFVHCAGHDGQLHTAVEGFDAEIVLTRDFLLHPRLNGLCDLI